MLKIWISCRMNICCMTACHLHKKGVNDKQCVIYGLLAILNLKYWMWCYWKVADKQCVIIVQLCLGLNKCYASRCWTVSSMLRWCCANHFYYLALVLSHRIIIFLVLCFAFCISFCLFITCIHTLHFVVRSTSLCLLRINLFISNDYMYFDFYN